MKKETVEKFFTFLDRKESTGIEQFNLQAAVYWREIERVKDSKDGTSQAFYQLMKKEGVHPSTVRINGDLDVDVLLDIAESMLQEGNVWGMDLYKVWAEVRHLEVSGNADFSGEFTSHLPATLIVGGDLDIRSSAIHSLPRYHLEVGGDFYIGGSSLWRSNYDKNEFRLEADLKERGFKIKGDIIYTESGPFRPIFPF